MKKRILKYLCSRTFKAFFLSYVGILLIAFGVLSMFGVWHIVENVRDENLRITKNKLYTIVEDMELQIESMQEIAVEIATFPEFRLNYLNESKYYEIEMLERLSNYRQLFGIYEGYFLKYKKRDIVYTSQGNTSSFELYYKREISSYGFEKVNEVFEELYEGTGNACVVCRQDDMILFCYPLKNYTMSKSGREGVLCFQISEKSLNKRIEQLVQLPEGELYLFYKDFCLLTPKETGTEDVSGALQQISSKGNYNIIFRLNENNHFLWSNIFTRQEVILFVGILFLMLFMGIGVAYWNYRPLEKITEKYKGSTEDILVADWDSIDALIESLLQGRKQSNEMLQKQFRIIREQIIHLIISGKYSERIQEHMLLLNIRPEGAVYGVIRCMIPAEVEVKRYREWLHKAVDDLSGEGIILYSCWSVNGDFLVLASVEEEYQLKEAEELLQSLFETKAWRVSTRITDVCHELEEIGRKVSSENTDNRHVNHGTGEEDGIKITEKNSTAKQVVGYIRENCVKYDLTLELLAEEFQVSTSYLCRIIKQEVGKNYKEYLTELRLDEAKRLLREKEISVVDVCYSIGYTNVSHFIKIFQKYEGVTPANYRKENGYDL